MIEGASEDNPPAESWALQERPLTPEQIEMLRPGNAALVIIDVQKAYLDPNEILAKDVVQSTTHKLDEISQGLAEFIEIARTAGTTIVWTKMTEDPKFMSNNYQVKMRIEDIPPISTPGTYGFGYLGDGLAETDPRSKLKPKEGEKEIIKRTYSAFNKTGLDQYLRQLGISTIVLIGAYTSRCVLSTAVSAADDYEYNVFVIRDLVGMLDKDYFEQNAALRTMGTILGYVPYSRQVTEVWQPKPILDNP